MPKQNFFSGITISYDKVISLYYPVNRQNPYFDHFVFQSMIDGGESADNNFTLAAYAAEADGTVLNNGEQLTPTTELNDKIPLPKKKKNIQFANMHLDLTALGVLYPQRGATPDLSIIPQKHFYHHNGNETNYLAYLAVTDDGMGAGIITYPVDPSPPA